MFYGRGPRALTDYDRYDERGMQEGDALTQRVAEARADEGDQQAVPHASEAQSHADDGAGTLTKAERRALIESRRLAGESPSTEQQKPMSKAERRAIQERQRAGKAAPAKEAAAAAAGGDGPGAASGTTEKGSERGQRSGEVLGGRDEGPRASDSAGRGLAHAAERARSFDGDVVVLVSHGSFNPVHKDHLKMMVDARAAVQEAHRSAACRAHTHDERQARRDVLVLGVFGITGTRWLRAKGLGPRQRFADDARVQMLELAVAEHDWLFVADAALSTHAHSAASMIKALQAGNAFARESGSAHLRFVGVMGSDVRKGAGYHGERGVFVAERDEGCGLSSTKVRAALAAGDKAFLDAALPPAVLRRLEAEGGAWTRAFGVQVQAAVSAPSYSNQLSLASSHSRFKCP